MDNVAGPAYAAGIRPNDVLVAIDDQLVTNYDSVVQAILKNDAGDTVSVTYLRDDVQTSVAVELAAHPSSDGRPYLGVYANDWAWAQLNPIDAAVKSVGDIGRTISGSVTGVITALNPLNSLEQLTDENAPLESRPTTVVGVSQVGGVIGESDGFKGILLLLASVNVFVGVFNMLPLLPFDGGHAAIATYERIRSRRGNPYRADINKMVPVATTVVGLLAILLVTGLYLDITRPLG
jgi:membrane-associated protease RseP (regulator of RpoE activity)